jgi:hypothetical protein
VCDHVAKGIIGGIERLREKGESLKQPATAPKLDEETLTCKELGKVFNVSHEAIRIWEESGKLIDLGWERIPEATSPVRYRRLKTITLERRGENWEREPGAKGK